MHNKLNEIGLSVPTILLPNAKQDMKAWSVVACDQYTSQAKCWEEVKELIGEKPSTLKLILPEVYLETEQEGEIISDVNKTMAQYLNDGTLVEQHKGFILVDRATSHVPSRQGLMVALDLEQYDYNVGSQSLMRATEGTIIDRLPPRIKVRKNAPLELPHIMVLIDDPEDTVIGPLRKAKLEQVYNTKLMKNGGEIRGWLVDGENEIEQVADAITHLAEPKYFADRYQVNDKGVLLYAMGDGNHSFATAKEIWEELKKNTKDSTAIMNHPARYCLVELVNIHDQGLEFEAIHRVLFGIQEEVFLTAAKKYYKSHGMDLAVNEYSTLAAANTAREAGINDNCHAIPMITSSGYALFSIATPQMNLTVASLQNFLDEYLKEHSEVTIDYIHGDEVVSELGSKANNIGFFLPPIAKDSFFRTIIVDEALPRKTFSMGEADEKRYYLECRKIR